MKLLDYKKTVEILAKYKIPVCPGGLMLQCLEPAVTRLLFQRVPVLTVTPSVASRTKFDYLTILKNNYGHLQ
jgi:hypothetical protein